VRAAGDAPHHGLRGPPGGPADAGVAARLPAGVLMTNWREIPLRPHGTPWPGLNTRGGVLDPGAGQLEDGPFNPIVNEADVLEKRKGFVRGLNERFTGVVCGLFRYTDNCGVEYLVVADEDGIHVRQPFSIPSFLGSDALPFDDFEELQTTRWSPTTAYE